VPLVPWRRLVVVEERAGYRQGTLRWTPRPIVQFGGELRACNDVGPAVAAAARLRSFRQFLVWARFPDFDVRREGESTLVTAGDARYPGRGGSWAAVSAVVPVGASARDSRPRARDGGTDAATIFRMSFTRSATLALTGALAIVSASPAASKEVLPWVDDYGKAVAQARAKNVPIFVEAWAPW
ncbi:MAG TPA: hypothetical protein VFW81_06710, partial [Thermoanaerobaculia bacterium]|nr:hypothetical protein [Thermoanaerobaculia bacterium]